MLQSNRSGMSLILNIKRQFFSEGHDFYSKVVFSHSLSLLPVRVCVTFDLPIIIS
jgi:hypothetical protein